jgi:hypothetical protein
MGPRFNSILFAVSRRSHLRPRSAASVCLFCSLSGALRSQLKPRRILGQTRRAQSTEAAAQSASNLKRLDPRKRLEETLLDLKEYTETNDAVSLGPEGQFHLSRLELALRGLKQQPGHESIRIAVVAQTRHGRGASRTAKELIRLLLADPLNPKAEWERKLAAHDTARPLLVRVGGNAQPEIEPPQITFAREPVTPELVVPSAALGGNELELLLMEAGATEDNQQMSAAIEQSAEKPYKVPTAALDILSGITYPVHGAIVVSEGIMGATSAAMLSRITDRIEILPVVNFTQTLSDQDERLPFITLDVAAAAEGLRLVRQTSANAIQFERMWYKGNIPLVVDWLKECTATDLKGSTKGALRILIKSVLYEADAARAPETSPYMDLIDSHERDLMGESMAAWAEDAHTELQTQLDLAFAGRKWRELKWWKLFWRADDVSLLASELLAQRFLPEAGEMIIYHAGRMAKAGMTGPRLKETFASPLAATSLEEGPEPAKTLDVEARAWPTYISYTRRYLVEQTVPALQALAQKLVAQTVATSALATSLAALAYASSFGLYASSSIAALGLVWSLGRMQKKWDKARNYWEDEVREEGRKAIKATQASVDEVIDGSRGKTLGWYTEREARKEEREEVRDLVLEAESAVHEMR